MASNQLIKQLLELGGSLPPNATTMPDAEMLLMIDQLKQRSSEIQPGGAASAAMEQAGVWDEYSTPEAIVPFQQMSDKDLLTYIEQNAGTGKDNLGQQELDTRKKMDERKFLENLIDPETSSMVLGRTGAQIGAGINSALHVPASVAGLYSLITTPVESATGLDLGGKGAAEYAQGEEAKIRDFWNISEPRNINESAMNVAGALIPLPSTQKVEGILNVLEVATPFVVGGGVGRTSANAAVALGLDQTIREAVDSELTDYNTLFDYMGIPDAKEEAPLNPWAVGALGALGFMSVATPVTMQMLKQRKLTPRTAIAAQDFDPNAPKGLESLETTTDLIKAYTVDDKAVLVDLAERAGVPAFDHVKDLIDLDTQTEATMRVNEALQSGKLHAQYGDFNSAVPPRLLFDTYKQFPKELQADVDLYLKYGDFADDLRLQIAGGNGPPGAQHRLAQVTALRDQLRQKDPAIAAFSRDYQRVTEAVRDYLSTGPHGLLSPNANAGLARDRQHYVPYDLSGVDPNAPLLLRMAQATKTDAKQRTQDWFLMKRDVKNIGGIDNRANAVDTLMDYVHNSLISKLRNDVQNVFLAQMMASKHGAKTVLTFKTAAEAAKVDPKGIRTLTTTVGDETRYHVTSKLQHDLLTFDPLAINNPFMAGLHGMKKLAESGTTGPLSVTFAPTTMIRDTLAGITNSVNGTKGPSIIGTLAAVPQILDAKLSNAIAHSLEARLAAGNPLPFLDPNLQAQFAGMASRRYTASMHHLAQEAGGYDGSLLNSRVKIAENAMNELAKSADPIINHPLGKSLRHLAGGWNALFSAISEAPRYSAFVRNLEAGRSPKEAAKHARELTGSSTRSGRVYGADGDRLGVDSKSPISATVVQQISPLWDALTHSVMYTNPAIQGMRRTLQAASDSPVEWAMKNWITVGIPTLAAYAWNEMAGEDYVDYQQNRRSERDKVMELYIAIPGKRPEEGISIPIAHEQVMMMNPYQEMLYNLRSSNEEIATALVQSGANLLENVAGLPVPIPLALYMNIQGQSTPSNIMAADSYSITERANGLLPSNIDAAVRTMFGAISGTVLDVASAVGADPSITTAVEEFGASITKRTPIIKGTAGTKTNVTSFSPLSSEKQAKFDAFLQFKETWAQHFGPGAGMTSTTPITGTTTNDPDTPQGNRGVDIEVSRDNMAPIPTPRPTNPVYEIFGGMIYDTLSKNEPAGWTNTESRFSALTKQIRLLKGYTAGSKQQFEEYQRELETAPAKLEAAKESGDKKEIARLEEEMKALKIIEDNNLDLSKRYDVTHLISILEKERYNTIRQQLVIIEELEDQITDLLLAQGMIPPGRRFSIEKDLAPMDQSISPPQQIQQPVAGPL